jgi:hypothetical protein
MGNKKIPHSRNISTIVKIVEREKWILLTHKYMTDHFSDLVQALQ